MTDGDWFRNLAVIRERVIRDLAQVYRGNLFFGEDLMELPVREPVPRRLD